MTDSTIGEGLPPFPMHPDPHAWTWTAAEKRVITAYALAAVEAERERCAKVCESQAKRFTEGSPLEGGKPYAAMECAAAIRAATKGERDE